MADVHYPPSEVEQVNLLATVDHIKPDRDNPADSLFQAFVDESQKMQRKTTPDALPKFKLLMNRRYSVSHRTNQHKVYRLDAVDTCN